MKPVIPQLQEKLNESLQTIGNNANPRLSVIVARPKSSIQDSDYWTVETIREQSGLGDVSVAPRRFKPYGRPNRLYGFSIQNGNGKGLIREYPDKLKRGWTEIFDIGNASSVSLAFNGYWDRYRNHWRLITEEKPYITWVDTNGDLWVQKWDDISTKLQLASGVSKVEMIRAWKNATIQYLDQGIVVAYIKSGKVYYRNYCIQADYSEVWEAERELTAFTNTAINVNLFITHDYRMGFLIEDSNQDIHWFITQRNWGGMASPAENLTASIQDIQFQVVDVDYKNTSSDDSYIKSSINEIFFKVYYASSDNNFAYVGNAPIDVEVEGVITQDWGYKLIVTTSHGLNNIDPLNFDLVDTLNVLFTVRSIIEESPNHFIFETSNLNNAFGDLTLRFNGGNTKGEAGQSLDIFSKVFTPQHLVPTVIPLPEVEAIWNE